MLPQSVSPWVAQPVSPRPVSPWSVLPLSSLPQSSLQSSPQLTLPQPALSRPVSPSADGFLSDEKWGYIQDFNSAMERVQMEICDRCQEHWFAMELKDGVCRSCFLRDKGNQTPLLISAENNMDPGVLPAHLPILTQVEEIVIARSHIQMVLYHYHGHQYHYSGYCISFMQNMIKTVDVLPNLPSELDVVVSRPSDYAENETWYQHQFRSDFRVRKGHIITWLHFLKANHPGYRDITISPGRM
jgi:hypothetical protein